MLFFAYISLLLCFSDIYDFINININIYIFVNLKVKFLI